MKGNFGACLAAVLLPPPGFDPNNNVKGDPFSSLGSTEGGGYRERSPSLLNPRPCELNGSPLPFPRGPRGYFQIWEIVCGREGEPFLGRVQLSHLGNFFFCSAPPSTFSLSFLRSGRAARQSWAVQGRERWYRKLKASFRIKPRLKRERENEGVQTKRYKSFLIRKARFLLASKGQKD